MSDDDISRSSMIAKIAVISLFGLMVVVSFMNNPQTISAERPTASPITLIAYQTTDQLLIDVSLANPDKKKLQGTLRLELIGPNKKILSEVDKDIEQSDSTSNHRVEFSRLKATPEKITVRCRFGKDSIEMPFNQVLAVKAHETALSASRELFAGSI